MATPIPTKLIFGIRASKATQLVISGGPAGKALPLRLTTRDGGDTSVPCDNGTWTVPIAQGDHIVRIETPNESDWFEGILQFTVAPQAAIVFHGPERPESEHVTTAWSATQGTTGGPLGNDPKDPWPPPELNAVVTLDDPQWLTDTLHEARQNIAIVKQAPGGV